MVNAGNGFFEENVWKMYDEDKLLPAPLTEAKKQLTPHFLHFWGDLINYNAN
jgi:hypothetical protein